MAAMQYPSALFYCPGFRLEHISLDSMHCGDLGVFQDAIGGLFWVEVSNKTWHRTNQEGVDFLNRQMKLFYMAHPGLSEMHLTLSMLRQQAGHPTLKAKAAETRHLAGYALVLAHQHALGTAARGPFEFRAERLQPYSAEYRTMIVQMAQALHSYQNCIQADAFDRNLCKQAMYDFLRAMNGLRLLFRRHLAAEDHASMPFVMRPKAHMMQHLVEESLPLWGSPKHYWCYGDEDFVGVIKKIAVMTRHPRTLERVLLEKFRLYVGLHWHANA